eukprot:scaffold177574_cov17-Tisochrysis_lutea.AAC.1
MVASQSKHRAPASKSNASEMTDRKQLFKTQRAGRALSPRRGQGNRNDPQTVNQAQYQLIPIFQTPNVSIFTVFNPQDTHLLDHEQSLLPTYSTVVDRSGFLEIRYQAVWEATQGFAWGWLGSGGSAGSAGLKSLSLKGGNLLTKGVGSRT